ncbi:Protoporphyrinogen oxidase [Desulfurella amilsii]|uniref:Protoporphyrinogen oxidase n=1 Tax=Desulfurella amilsii TaxID=1562698 RepID=A0A1X4XW88_9BACT|nr:hypothetical protein [Desulfurella amilsii]OSS41778.1 Protoporphyrinogen oxidase [Desulfurella amilsii]
MPIKDLASIINPKINKEIYDIALNLRYRDFISVGLLYKKLLRQEAGACKIPDNWIYVQDKSMGLGRLQLFNNWSPFMVADVDNIIWLGLEYFCSEGDALWSMPDKGLIDLAKEELEKIGIAKKSDLLDGAVIKQKKATLHTSALMKNLIK